MTQQAEMEQVVPWKALLGLIEPHYPTAGRGRRPYPLDSMLRVHLMQNWFALKKAIHKHPAVLECAVIGFPDDKWGETVHALVVTRDGRMVAAEELIAHCRTLIAGYKCPRSMDISANPLPETAAGKISKNSLREPFWVGRLRRVH